MSRRRFGSLVVLALIGSPIPAAAQFVDPTLPVTDGSIFALAMTGDTLFAGGDLTYAGANTGGFAEVSAADGAPRHRWPRADGMVSSIAHDGAGGWYIAGNFHRVAGVVRNGLAHIRADGTLDAWDPGPNGTVYKFSLHGSVLYACGSFTVIGGRTQPWVAALDATTEPRSCGTRA
jgi:hypothetical protein